MTDSPLSALQLSLSGGSRRICRRDRQAPIVRISNLRFNFRSSCRRSVVGWKPQAGNEQVARDGGRGPVGRNSDSINSARCCRDRVQRSHRNGNVPSADRYGRCAGVQHVRQGRIRGSEPVIMCPRKVPRAGCGVRRKPRKTRIREQLPALPLATKTTPMDSRADVRASR